jgi:hypothetical protein
MKIKRCLTINIKNEILIITCPVHKQIPFRNEGKIVFCAKAFQQLLFVQAETGKRKSKE